MYTSDQMIAMLNAQGYKITRAGTPTNLTGYETTPPLTPADIQANAQITTIPGPQGITAQVQPGQKVPGYIPVPVGVPQWGMPASTFNPAAAQYSDTNMNFVSPLALSIEQHYKISAIAPVIRSQDAIQEAQARLEKGFDVPSTEVYQRNARQSSGENEQKVSQEAQVNPSPTDAVDISHRMHSWYWQ